MTKMDGDSLMLEIAKLIEEAEVQAKLRRKAKAYARRANDDAREASRLLSACATFACPGDDAEWIDDTMSEALRSERLGRNPKWHECNEEFCERWVDLWVQSVPHVRRSLIRVGAGESERDLPGASGIREIETHGTEASVAKFLYLVLLDADNIESARESVHAQLATARIDLDCLRFNLQEFFDQVRIVPRPLSSLRTKNHASNKLKMNSERRPKKGREAKQSQSGAAVGSRTGANRFSRDGDLWSVRFEDASFSVTHVVGMPYIAILLQHQGEDVHVQKILSLAACQFDNLHMSDSLVPGDVNPGESTQAVSDEDALESYRKRLDEIGREREEAEALGDFDKICRLDDEVESLKRLAYGRFAPRKKLAGAESKARDQVRSAIRAALKKLDAKCPLLVAHLKKALIRPSSVSPRYSPEKRVDWQIAT